MSEEFDFLLHRKVEITNNKEKEEKNFLLSGYVPYIKYYNDMARIHIIKDNQGVGFIEINDMNITKYNIKILDWDLNDPNKKNSKKIKRIDILDI